MNSTPSTDLKYLVSILNFNLGPVGQGIRAPNRRLSPIMVATVLLSTVYTTYLFRCMLGMHSLEAISEIVWVVPIMMQYLVMTINGYFNYQTALAITQWMADIFQRRHAVAEIRTRVQSANEKCTRIGRIIFGCVLKS